MGLLTCDCDLLLVFGFGIGLFESATHLIALAFARRIQLDLFSLYDGQRSQTLERASRSGRLIVIPQIDVVGLRFEILGANLEHCELSELAPKFRLCHHSSMIDGTRSLSLAALSMKRASP